MLNFLDTLVGFGEIYFFPSNQSFFQHVSSFFLPILSGELK